MFEKVNLQLIPAEKGGNFQTFIQQNLRRAFYKSKIAYAIIASKRIAPNTWLCYQCKKKLRKGEFHLEHVDPVIDPKKGFENWDLYIYNLCYRTENMDIMCKPCHKEKTKKEASIAYEYKTGRYSKEAIELRSNTLKARWAAGFYAHKNWEKRQCRVLIKKGKEVHTFKSVQECADWLKVKRPHVSRVLGGNRKTLKGWRIEYETK